MSDPADDRLPSAAITSCDGRVKRLREAISAHPIDGLLISNATDIRYLTGFVGDDSLLLVGGVDGATIISDTRYDEFLEPWAALGHVDVVMGTRHQLEKSVERLSRSGGIRRLGVQAEYLTIAHQRTLATIFPAEALVATEGLVGQLRIRKDDQEIRSIERAASIQSEAMRVALRRLAPGMTELAFCATVEFEMKVRGASGPSFATMVATGPRSSVIHHQTGTVTIGQGVLLVDWGAVADGYCSDMTRTFGLGGLPAKISEIYQIVLDAQLAAIEACRPGKACIEIDSIARDLITAAGYGERFGHGLGHGLGLNVHEAPYFSRHAADAILEPGMVMTVEPGIYLPGVGGVRIEDDVLITDAGCRVLTDYPKDLDSIMLEPITATAGGRLEDSCHA